MITIDEALKTILSSVEPTTEIETVPLMQAHRRILAQTQYAAVNVPPADNSAMDGYAINTEDLTPNADTWLPVTQRIPAGHAPLPLGIQAAARIFTGGEIPAGANAVVMQEDCGVSGVKGKSEKVIVPCTVPVGNNIRPKGQDIRKSDEVLPKGRRLEPQDLGLLASVGIDKVPVYRRLKVAVLSTGDELTNPGEDLLPGKIYNSNRFTMAGLLSALDLDMVDMGMVADTREATEKALSEAAAQSDCVITSGGVSVGEEDHVKGAVETLGALNVWKLAIKPGKPLAFGHIKNSGNGKTQKSTPFFGLPGNPVSVFVTFAIIVRPYLQRLQGRTPTPLKTLTLPITFDCPRNPKRQEYLRVRINEHQQVENYRTQNSGVLSSTSWADALAVVPAQSTLTKGDKITVIPLRELLHL